MLDTTVLLHILLMFAAGMTAVLVTLVIYGNALDSREDEELYINKTTESMMASGQKAIVSEMHRLARAITAVAVITGIALLAAAGMWVYVGLFRS